MSTKKLLTPKLFISHLKNNNIPFEMSVSVFTKTIVCEYGTYKYYSKESNLKNKDLNFIMAVKRHCEKLDFKTYPTVERKNINYILPSLIKKNYHYKKDLFEIDLSGAYWESAKQLNFINDEIYKKGLEVNKKVRLIALGNLAKRLCVLKYDGNSYLKPTFTPEKQTAYVFWAVSYETDILIRKLMFMAGNNFCFYWVDAIIFKGIETKNNIESFLNDNSIKYKTFPLMDVIKKGATIEVTDLSHEHKRIFNFKSK